MIQHRARLLNQLDALLQVTNARAPDARDPDASREIIAIRPLDPAMPLAAEQLRDKANDVRLIGVVEETGTVLLDAPGPELQKLREHAAEFGEPKPRTRDGVTTMKPAHVRSLAPVEEIALASSQDWEGPRLRAAVGAGDIALDRAKWFEVTCRGGYRNNPAETSNSRSQIQSQLHRLRHVPAQEFEAPEDVSFFVRLSLADLRGLVMSIDCVFGYDLAPNDLLSWFLLTDPPRKEIRQFALAAPPADAPAVVILDSGIATEHPLLRSAVLPSASVLPGISSPVDTYGHGTKMAGVGLYEGDVGRALERGSFEAPHWVQGVRILVRPREGTASEENRTYWPQMTADAVKIAETLDPVARARAFVLAVTYPLDPLLPSTYTQAVDQLAFHDAKGRLLCVSAGNVAPGDLFESASTYPAGLVLRRIQEPAHGLNVLTVGAYTEKTRLPPDPDYKEAVCVAPRGALSPHTTTGPSDPPWPIKPEIVLEGGNVALAAGIADPGIDSLVTLTTGHDLLKGPLASINATSEASARAAHLAAVIWKDNPQLRPATIRGLLVHSASWTPVMRTHFPVPDLFYTCGYGVPDVEFARACTNDRATVIVEDEMPNYVEMEVPKKQPPKKATTPTVENIDVRKLKIFRMPIPDSILHASPDANVELRVTLSYFPEPSTFRMRVDYGIKLKWDMQGPLESETQFIERVNDLHRQRDDAGKRKKKETVSFDWTVGTMRRSRGTVQSDRWIGKAAMLAGSKLVAVIPVQGWWERRTEMQRKSQPFTLIVSVVAAGIYDEVKAGLTLPVPIEV